jgi:hypothetical protein
MPPGALGPVAAPRSIQARFSVLASHATDVEHRLTLFRPPCELLPSTPRKHHAQGKVRIALVSLGSCSSRASCSENEHGLLSSLAPYKLKTHCSLSAFVNRGPDDCDANSSSSSAHCGAASGTHDNSCAVPPSNACRRGLRGRPSYGNHGGPDHRLGPVRWPLETWGGP